MVLAALLVIFLVRSPIRTRIKQEWNAQFSVIHQDKFSPADYFSGVQFRILTWRFAFEILNERSAWITGVNPGDAQDVLKEKYLRENMFAGGTPGNKTGYLGYHTHNQFLQAVLESGFLGLTAFLLMWTGLIRFGRRVSRWSYSAYIVLILCNCFTDAPLTTQYGIILFVFFPLFMFKAWAPDQPGS
jgi:O-antigen ligase